MNVSFKLFNLVFLLLCIMLSRTLTFSSHVLVLLGIAQIMIPLMQFDTDTNVPSSIFKQIRKAD